MQAVWRQSPLLVCRRDREGATTRHTSFPGARFASQVRPQGEQLLAGRALTVQLLAAPRFPERSQSQLLALAAGIPFS